MLANLGLCPSVCIISIYRMFTLRAGVISQDPSWENIGAAIWSCIELNVSIIASTLPTLRPLIARLFPGIGLSSANKSHTTYLRYGSASGPMRGGTFKSEDRRNHKTQSISTEELALEERRPSPAGSIVPTTVYVDPLDGHAKSFSSGGGKDKNGIVMTREIWVDSHAR